MRFKKAHNNSCKHKASLSSVNISNTFNTYTFQLGNKPHVCKICGKRFRVPYSLREHELTHDKAEQQRRKIYPCTLCSKRFQFRNQVKFHMQKRHSIMDPRLPQTQEIPK